MECAQEGEPPAVLVPFTFRILDERRPLIYAPNVANEPSIRFFRQFPKLGAYQVRAGEAEAGVSCCGLFALKAGRECPSCVQE